MKMLKFSFAVLQLAGVLYYSSTTTEAVNLTTPTRSRKPTTKNGVVVHDGQEKVGKVTTPASSTSSRSHSPDSDQVSTAASSRSESPEKAALNEVDKFEVGKVARLNFPLSKSYGKNYDKKLAPETLTALFRVMAVDLSGETEKVKLEMVGETGHTVVKDVKTVFPGTAASSENQQKIESALQKLRDGSVPKEKLTKLLGVKESSDEILHNEALLEQQSIELAEPTTATTPATAFAKYFFDIAKTNNAHAGGNGGSWDVVEEASEFSNAVNVTVTPPVLTANPNATAQFDKVARKDDQALPSGEVLLRTKSATESTPHQRMIGPIQAGGVQFSDKSNLTFKNDSLSVQQCEAWLKDDCLQFQEPKDMYRELWTNRHFHYSYYLPNQKKDHERNHLTAHVQLIPKHKREGAAQQDKCAAVEAQ